MMHPVMHDHSHTTISRVSRLGGFLALTLVLSTHMISLAWAAPIKPSDPMPAIAKRLPSKTSMAETTTIKSDPLSQALTQLLTANHITPIVQVRQGRHNKVEVLSNRMHYVLTLDHDLLKPDSGNEAALIALQLAAIEPASVALNSLSVTRRSQLEYRAATLLSNANLSLTPLETLLNDAVKQPKQFDDMGYQSYSLSAFDTPRLVSFQRWLSDNRLQQARLSSRATGQFDGSRIAPLLPTTPSITGLQGAIEASMTSPKSNASSESMAGNYLAFSDPTLLQPSPIIQLMMSLSPAQVQLLSTLREQGTVNSSQLARAVSGMNRRQLDGELATLVQKQLIERASGRYKLSQWASEALWFPGKATP